jgi:hypothetical protein
MICLVAGLVIARVLSKLNNRYEDQKTPTTLDENAPYDEGKAGGEPR